MSRPPHEPLTSGEAKEFYAPLLGKNAVIGPQFPKLETWGPMDCPYPTAAFDAVKEALLRGGQLATFAGHPECALANLVGAAWRDGTWKSVLVICDGCRSARQLIEQLLKVLEVMALVGSVVSLNNERIELRGGFQLIAIPRRIQHLRSLCCDHLVFLMTEPIKELQTAGRELYVMSLDFGENYELREANFNHLINQRWNQWWNADLKMAAVDFGDPDDWRCSIV